MMKMFFFIILLIKNIDYLKEQFNLMYLEYFNINNEKIDKMNWIL
jgi:hypothetical protein